MTILFRKLLIFLLMALLAPQVHAQSKTIRYTESGDTLDTITRRYLPELKSKYGENAEEFKRDLVRWNSHIKDWNNQSAATPFYITYPYPPFVPGPYGAGLSINDSPRTSPEIESRFTNFVFYMASLGQFTEQTTGNQTIKSFQNSPVSLGFGTSYKIQEQNSVSASVYWSRLVSSKVEGSVANAENKISIPNEYGMNLYYQQRILESNFSGYAGVDHENFATYNTAELVPGSTLKIRTNSLSYVTAGLAAKFLAYGYTLSSKMSLAQVILSDCSTGVASDNLKGNRFLLFASVRKAGPFSYQFLYKHHSLEGPTKLSINRFGLGLSYAF